MTRDPDFLLIGAPKCGSTTLWSLLRRHPEIHLPEKPKELNYFSRHYELGPDWYRAHFRAADGAKIVGDNSPSYCCQEQYPGTADRIGRDLPGAKILYIVRHPFERIESAWIQGRTTSVVRRATIRGMIEDAPKTIHVTRYWTQIEAYRKHFPDDRILVLFTEDLHRDVHGTLRRIFEFLEVDAEVRIDSAEKKRNVSVGNKEVDRKALLHLREKVPGFSIATRLIPGPMRRAMKGKFFKTKLQAKERMDADTRRFVLARIEDDVKRILEYGGKPADFWKLDPDA